MTDVREDKTTAAAVAAVAAAGARSCSSARNKGLGERAVPLSNLRRYLTCRLCGQWFTDAHSITECLHTFCRPCLLRHFDDESSSDDDDDDKDKDDKEDASGGVRRLRSAPASRRPDDDIGDLKGSGSSQGIGIGDAEDVSGAYCPTCKIPLGADPMKNAVLIDHTMQNLVRQVISAKRQMASTSMSTSAAAQHDDDSDKATTPTPSHWSAHKHSPRARRTKAHTGVMLLLELAPHTAPAGGSSGTVLPPLDRPFLHIDAGVTVRTLEKFVLQMLAERTRMPADKGAMSRRQVELLCCGGVLGAEYTLVGRRQMAGETRL